MPASGSAPMEIGPEPRRPCDFPGQPAHQNGPRSRPMGMGRAFSCPFLGNSSAPRGAAGARSALKSPGGGFRPPPGDFRLPGPGALGPGPPNAAAPPSDAPASPKAESRPRPILDESAGQPNPFFRKGPSRKLSLSPMFQGLWPATFGKGPPRRRARAALPGMAPGGRRRLAARGPKAPGPAKQKERAPGPALLGRFAPCRRPPRRHPRQGSSRFPPAEAGAKAAGFRQ